MTQLKLTRHPTEDLVTTAPAHDFAAEFLAMIERWDSLPEVYDKELDVQIHTWAINVAARYFRFPRQPYFTPSSIDMCPRANYLRLKGAKRDSTGQQPHQKRWTEAGTAFGDTMQRKLLFIEKHWPRIFNEPAPFTVERNEYGEPMWEEHARVVQLFAWRGREFSIFALPDGILRHTATGKRVLVEFKSKQTTPSRTSAYTMRDAEEKHAAQVATYSLIYGVAERLIVYGNLAKKAWFMDAEEYEKNPDLRVFHATVSETAREMILDACADRLDEVAAGVPPLPDLTNWTFNSYKTAVAHDLTDDEMAQLRDQVERVKAAKTMKPFQKQAYADALADIERIRNQTKGADAA